MGTVSEETTAERKPNRPGARWYCPTCQKAVVLYVPCLRASCTRCGPRLVPGDPALN